MMQTIYRLIAIAGLLLTLIPSLLLFTGAIPAQLNKSLMVVGMILWFVAAPFWNQNRKQASSAE
jgi:high-affinity Fe2+/Pb2+ permease